MLMGTNDCGVEQQSLQVGQLDRLEHASPNARFRPAVEPLKDRIPLAVTLGQIPPRSPASSNPNHAVHKPPIVFPMRTRIPFLAWEKLFDPSPLLVREFVSTHR